MSQLIVGIGYKKNQGKDTLADLMINCIRMRHPTVRVRKIGFADKLKDISHQMFGWSGLKPGIYYDTHYKEKELILPEIGKTPRDIWIAVGNNFRAIYPKTWIDIVLYGVPCDILFVKDMGFRNEIKAIRNVNGYTINITRKVENLGTDPREIELDGCQDWDYCVDNNGTIRDLNKIAEKISESLVGRL